MKVNTILSLALASTLASAFPEIGLKEYARDFKIGLALNGTYWESVEGYTDAIDTIFNYGVAENGCKMAYIQPEKGVYDFSELLNHYRGKIDTWDVVNEAIDDSSSGEGFQLRPSFLYNEVPDFVDLAFKTAREVDPTVKLYYNDYDNDGAKMAKSLSVYNFVKDLVERGVPIDGVGIQYHAKLDKHPKYEDVVGIMAKYAELGLEVQVTEIDVRINEYTQENLEKQAEIFGVALKACLDSPNCTAFLTWGLADNQSWRVGLHPLLLDDDLKPKPAYYTLLNILKEYNSEDEGSESDEDIEVSGAVDVVEDEDSEENQ
eukprot:jgi/Orpsp1_1/1187035/evm.model.d7180000055002.1